MCLEIWEPQPPGTPMACQGLYSDSSSFVTIPQHSVIARASQGWRMVSEMVILSHFCWPDSCCGTLSHGGEQRTANSPPQESKYFRLRGPRGRGKIEDMYSTRSEIICVNCITNNVLFFYFFLPYPKNPFKNTIMSTVE